MVIDLRKCIGCGSCVSGCKENNRVPKNFWKKVHDCGVSQEPERQRMFLHLSCMHCSAPPCLSVCPTGATRRRTDGIIDIDYEICAGCGACIVACPYGARSIYRKEHDFELNAMSMDFAEGETSDREGVCTKCNFCLPRIRAGLNMGLEPGVDAEASPVCMNSCNSGVISFGDLEDPESVVSQLISKNRIARLQEELDTDPGIYFIRW
jgi:phenylacetyl-CoA:acceptor oxidoreductase 27-kDa subunit